LALYVAALAGPATAIGAATAAVAGHEAEEDLAHVMEPLGGVASGPGSWMNSTRPRRLVAETPTGYGGPVSTPRRYQRLAPAERRDQILDAANELFAERGYDAVTIEEVAKSAGVARGLVHHYFGGRTEVYVSLVERLGAAREDQLRAPEGRNARERVADSVSRWLDWTEANRTIYLGTIAPGEDIADPEVRRVVTELVHRAVALVATFHGDIAEDSPRLRYALECWTGLNRAATRRWLRGDATREATHELLASTLEHVLRTFGSAPDRGTARPDRSP